MLVDVVIGGQAGADQPVADLRDGGLFEQVSDRPGHREEGIGLDVNEAGLAQQSGQGPPVGQINTTLGHQHAEIALEFVGQPLRWTRFVRTDQRLHHRVRLLDQQPAAGPQRCS
ncbi:MAG: hypothetical protein ACRDSP_25755 [Pseudonocardiaceae bacterium]